MLIICCDLQPCAQGPAACVLLLASRKAVQLRACLPAAAAAADSVSQ
jgi:hypothetical protein